MAVQSALVGKAAGQYELVHHVPVPDAGPGRVVCKVAAVAVNPTDWKLVNFSVVPGAVGGHDFAGEVVAVGEGATRLRKGDRVFGLALGLNRDDVGGGAFAEYVHAHEHLVWKIPDWMAYEDAATFGVGVGTATLALYHFLGLPAPTDGPTKRKKPVYVLIAGGATATGTITIQLAKASGLAVIVTCSPQHRDYLISLGAEATFDYTSPQCAMEIRKHTNDRLEYAIDCISDASTMKACYDAIGSAGGRYVGLEPPATEVQYTRRAVRADWVISRTLTGLPVRLDGAYGRPARPQDRVFAETYFLLAERLIAQGRLRPHPVEVREGGLERVVEGIEDVRRGGVRGKKLVYTV